ncbi:Protein of unknown function [Bacillus thuringiensis]|nr:Protein of unknown function [Bacillus thuringiensis]
MKEVLDVETYLKK